jgi:hypothetical protein
MRRILIAFLVIAAVAIGGGFIASAAYQAGLSANVTAVQSTDGATGAPVVVHGAVYGWGHGWGWGPGFGILGFLGTLFVIFLFIALIRALMFRGGPGGRSGPWGGGPRGGGPRGGGPRGWGGTPWESRAHETFDDWHRDAHAGSGESNSTAGSGGPTASATPS